MNTIDISKLSENQLTDLVNSSYVFLQALNEIVGPQKSYELFENFDIILGEDIKLTMLSRILSGEIEKNSTSAKFIALPGKQIANKISAIRDIRTFSSLGLRESKAIVDNACLYFKQTVTCTSLENAELLRESLRNNGFHIIS